MKSLSTDLEQDRKIGERGFCRAEMAAIGDWRMVNGERQVVNGE